MSDLAPRPIRPSIEPDRPGAQTQGDLIRRVAADLTPAQSYRVTRKIQRQRMKATVELARIEDEALLEDALTIARAKVRSTVEQAEALLHAERTNLLAQAALDHEEASRIIGLVKDDAAHALFQEALKGASVRYASGVIRRSGS